jgi:hypothetical protein
VSDAFLAVCADKRKMAITAPWLIQVLDALAAQPAIGYSPGAGVAAEPTAIAALALAVHGRGEGARKAAETLAAMQGASGAVGIRSGEQSPGWPSSLAIIAWQTVDGARFRDRIDRAVSWLLANRGLAVERSAEFGHDTTLVGWAYAEQTHSWVEPTAFAVLALRAAGKANDSAAREGASMLLDRQLPGGGLNYGNTYVLGQLIRPHVQPTGIGLLALSGERDSSGRIAKTIMWLQRSIGAETTPMSLSWAVLGLRAHGVVVAELDDWLAVAARRTSGYKLALLALAAKGWPA